MTNTRSEVKLEAPGAGLPPIEGFFVRQFLFPLVTVTMTREKSVAVFLGEGRRSLESARALSEADMIRPVLIERFIGIEDSSRFWSVAMTLEHMIVVGKGVLNLIQTLSAGKIHPREVRIQDVKPTSETGSEVLDDYDILLDRYAESGLLDLPYPKTPRLEHPWLGQLDASKWLKMNAMHNLIHRKQIDRIIEKL